MTVLKRELPLATHKVEPTPEAQAMFPERQRDEVDLAWDAYFIPDLPDDVLRNKLGNADEPYGMTDGDLLLELEEGFTATRMIEQKRRPIPGNFDFAHMRRIHQHLFQDVYEWAGEPRNVPMNKAGFTYLDHENIDVLWGAQEVALEQQDFLRGIEDQAEFTDLLAKNWGMVNFTHAFREGNTRSQTIFFHELAKQAGWDLDVSRFSPDHPESIRDEFVAARYFHQSHKFDHAPLAAALGKVITKRQPELEQQRDLEADAEPSPEAYWAAKHAEEAKASPAPGAPLSRYQRFPELAPEFPLARPEGRHSASQESDLEL